MRNNFIDYVVLRILFDWNDTVATYDENKFLEPSPKFQLWSECRNYCDLKWNDENSFFLRLAPDDAKEFIDWYQNLVGNNE